MATLKKLPLATIGVTSIALGTIVAAPSHAVTLTGISTFGDDMVGMQVTANFLGGGSQTVTWGATGSNSGGAVGTDWSLTQTGDTFKSPWTFSNNGRAITSLGINAIPGNTLFDQSPPDVGQPFTVQSGRAPDSFAYSVPVENVKTSSGAILDAQLFGTLSLSYNSGFTGVMSYLADTDKATDYDPVVEPKPTLTATLPTPIQPISTEPTPTAVPEPPSSTAGLLVFGAFGAGLLMKRKKKLSTKA